MHQGAELHRLLVVDAVIDIARTQQKVHQLVNA
jgi:hypothetical protein